MADEASRVEAAPIAIRPSRRLVRVVAIAAVCALVAVPVPLLVAPTIAFLVVIVVLAILDWRNSRSDPHPMLERIIPDRLVKGRAATVSYLLTRPDGDATVVSILDELPADLGGDLLIDDVGVGRDERREISREAMPIRRGTRELGPTYILWRSRLSLLRFRAVVASGGSVAILPPSSSPRGHAGLTHRSVHDDLGVRPRKARGEGSEFESLREYVSGDDPRHVDWHASARRMRLIVRQYQTERHHTVMIAVDTGRLMASLVDGSSKLDHAIDCAVALARASKEYGDRVGFIAFDRELRVMARPRSGPSGVSAIVAATLKLEPFPHEPNYRVLVETLARYQRKRALIVVITDFVEGSASAELEAYLGVLARRHYVMLVAMRDPLLGELDDREPEITSERLYRRLALQDLVGEREAALARIARFGAQTLDLDPARITAPVLNRYLAIRNAGLL
jgi:uncharacterized protein (DUF58 family)